MKAVDGAEVAPPHAPPGLLESRIEAALETDLHAPLRPVDVVDDASRRLEVQRDRLLAEDREALVERAADELRVRPGGGHDHRGVRPGKGGVDGRRVLRAEGVCQRGCPPRVGVVDPKLVDAWELAQDLGVERTEAAHAEDRDLHSTRL